MGRHYEMRVGARTFLMDAASDGRAIALSGCSWSRRR